MAFLNKTTAEYGRQIALISRSFEIPGLSDGEKETAADLLNLLTLLRDYADHKQIMPYQTAILPLVIGTRVFCSVSAKDNEVGIPPGPACEAVEEGHATLEADGFRVQQMIRDVLAIPEGEGNRDRQIAEFALRPLFHT
jgi:hypothetical protein